MDIGREAVPFTGGSQRVRDYVLVILSEEFPLTVKEIYRQVLKQGNNVTYQAVHKVITQLLSENILEKKGKNVQLSSQWIERVKDYAFTVNVAYFKGKEFNLPRHLDQSHRVTFDDYSSYVTWLAENFRDGKFTGRKPSAVYGMFRHALFPLRFNFMDFNLLRAAASSCTIRGSRQKILRSTDG
ncbi:MAG: hypothetical protein V1776_00855 [Candidatus Diapherotrites archaeon]